MKSETGSLLTKISAIINLVFAGLAIFFGLIAILGISAYSNFPKTLSIIIFALAALSLIMGLLLWNASKKMQDKKTVKSGAIWAIILGIILITNVSGILALIGGIFALVDSDK